MKDISCLQFVSKYATVLVNISVSLEDIFPDEEIILYNPALDMTLSMMTPVM